MWTLVLAQAASTCTGTCNKTKVRKVSVFRVRAWQSVLALCEKWMLFPWAFLFHKTSTSNSWPLDLRAELMPSQVLLN